MNDQRMVDVELLRPFVALLQEHNDQGDDSRPVFAINDALITLGDLRKLRAVIDGPGVEPAGEILLGDSDGVEVDEWDVEWNQRVIDHINETSNDRSPRPLYLAAPSAPVPPDDQGPFDKSRLKRLVTQVFGDGWQIVPPSAPVPAVHLSDIWDGILERRQNAPVQAVPDWQPIETAPKDGTEIIASNVSVAGGFMQVVAYDALYSAPWRAQEDYGYSERAFTHWMPRPQPPKAVCSKRNSPSLCEDNGRACDERAPQPPLSSDGGKSTAQSVACPDDDYWTDQRIAACPTDKEK